MMDSDVGTAMQTGYSADGWLGVFVDSHGKNSGEAAHAVMGSYGFSGRPRPANDSGIGAQMLFGEIGDDAFAWIGHDPRDIELLPKLTEGSSAQYSARGAFALLDYDTETYTVYVPLANASKAHVLVMGYDNSGHREASFVHADGGGLIVTESSTVLKNHKGTVFLELAADALNIAGAMKVVGGLDVGGGTAVNPAVSVVLLPAFAAWFGGLAAALTAQGTTPLTGASLGAALSAAAAELSATGSTLLKGL